MRWHVTIFSGEKPFSPPQHGRSRERCITCCKERPGNTPMLEVSWFEKFHGGDHLEGRESDQQTGPRKPSTMEKNGIFFPKFCWYFMGFHVGKYASHCQSHGFYQIYYLVLHSFLKKGRMIPTVVPTTCLWTFHHLGLMRKFGLGILW